MQYSPVTVISRLEFADRQKHLWKSITMMSCMIGTWLEDIEQ
tara:strand:+ start:1475 stop:1600 length:126 start_codon:yes stop_codon:yes gene_type:complete